MARVLIQMNPAAVISAVKKANIKTLMQAGGAVRLTARRSIRISPKYADPGKPPKSRHGALRNAIWFAQMQSSSIPGVVVGPQFSDVGPSGGAHEHGGIFRGRHYPLRKFMLPALEKILPRLENFWAYSVTK